MFCCASYHLSIGIPFNVLFYFNDIGKSLNSVLVVTSLTRVVKLWCLKLEIEASPTSLIEAEIILMKEIICRPVEKRE